MTAPKYVRYMSEIEVYGTKVYSSHFFAVREDYEHLGIYPFKDPNCNRDSFWLRDVPISSVFPGGAGHIVTDTYDTSLSNYGIPLAYLK